MTNMTVYPRAWLVQKFVYAVAVTLLILITGGCATPVGVTSLGRNYGYEQIDRSALNSRMYSSYTATVLHRYDLERVCDRSPTSCLVRLHALACSDNRNDTLFALAELSFLQGKRKKTSTVNGRRMTPRNYYAASTVYSYLFLSALQKDDEATPFDRRFRIACDLYNRSLGYIVSLRDLPSEGSDNILQLPVGSIRVRHGHSDFPKPLSSYPVVVSADRYKIHGLSVRNRTAGMGSPIIIASQKKLMKRELLTGVAATLFIRVQGGVEDFEKESLFCDVEVYSASATQAVAVNGKEIPLETDITTPIAYTLDDPIYWTLESALFRHGQSVFAPGIYPMSPHETGRIPVLWVHGTMSSPVWWAEMWNTLQGDPALREKYEHWFYLYDSAKPITQSALHLRKSIGDRIRKIDPDGKDPALRQMVVIGHSQGGLLTKLTATETGDALIRAATGKTFSDLHLSPEDEKLVREYTQCAPLPEVKRVVFISTPHRGSFLAGGLARRMIKWVVTLPQNTVQTSAQLMRLAPKVGANVKIASTSIDSMSPDNPALLALAEIPVAPPIKAHSIIAIKDDSVPPAGDDGVVKYTSAHIEGVESELVVRSGHSCQGRPTTIEEVRRILLEHLRAARPQ